MIVYISGPMSGMPGDNFPAFFEAEERLRAAGYVPINPARGSTPISGGRRDDGWIRSEAYRTVLAKCMVDLERAQGLAQLPGWRDSNGGQREHFRAVCKAIPVMSVEEWIEWDTARCIKWVGDPECMPTQSYPGDAGFDLVVSRDTRIRVDEAVDVPLGIRAELPPETWAMLVGRSSTMRKRGLLVVQAVIDQGYRGPLFAYCRNLSDRVVEVVRGERVAQLIPMSLVAPGLGVKRVEELSESERGERAFGSSGGFDIGYRNPFPGPPTLSRIDQGVRDPREKQESSTQVDLD